MSDIGSAAARAADEAQPLLSRSATAAASDTESNASSATVRIASAPEAVQDARQEIGLARGVPIVVAMAFLIFFQAMNISLLTTTQSTIAADLNAFDSVSWFTSAYLVSNLSIR